MTYAKKLSAKTTIHEAQQLAERASYPAIVGTRFALILSGLSFVLSAITLAVAVRR